MDMFSKPSTPKPAPMADEKQLEQARLQKTAQIQARSGRDSTILTDQLGG